MKLSTTARGSAPASLLRFASVSFAFEGEAPLLRAVDLALEPGESLALLGENGTGKSTLLNLCLGYLRPTSGTLDVLGEEPRLAGAGSRSKLAYVPEIARLYPTMTGGAIIAFFSRLVGVEPSPERCGEALVKVGFPLAALGRPTATYSKGMRQKLVLALGLLKGACLFLLDEPTSGLDPQSRRDLAAAIRQLAAEGAGVLFTTHDTELVAAAATRCAVLDAGSLALRDGGGHGTP